MEVTKMKIIRFLIVLLVCLSQSLLYAEKIKGKTFINSDNLLGSVSIMGISDPNFFENANRQSIKGIVFGGKDIDIGYCITDNFALALGLGAYGIVDNSYSYDTEPEYISGSYVYAKVNGEWSLVVNQIMPKVIYHFPTTSNRSFGWVSLGIGFTNLTYKNNMGADYYYYSSRTPFGISVYAQTSPNPTVPLTMIDIRIGGDYKISKYVYWTSTIEGQTGSRDLDYYWSAIGIVSNIIVPVSGQYKANIDLGGYTISTGLRIVFGGVPFETK